MGINDSDGATSFLSSAPAKMKLGDIEKAADNTVPQLVSRLKTPRSNRRSPRWLPMDTIRSISCTMRAKRPLRSRNPAHADDLRRRGPR